MAVSLKEAEYSTDIILHRVEQLVSERNNLRKELSRKSAGNLEQDKAFVMSYQNSVIDNFYASQKITKLENLLMIR